MALLEDTVWLKGVIGYQDKGRGWNVDRLRYPLQNEGISPLARDRHTVNIATVTGPGKQHHNVEGEAYHVEL